MLTIPVANHLLIANLLYRSLPKANCSNFRLQLLKAVQPHSLVRTSYVRVTRPTLII